VDPNAGSNFRQDPAHTHWARSQARNQTTSDKGMGKDEAAKPTASRRAERPNRARWWPAGNRPDGLAAAVVRAVGFQTTRNMSPKKDGAHQGRQCRDWAAMRTSAM